MKYLDYFYAKDEIEEIEKKDNLYIEGIVSLDDKENQQFLDSYVYQMYLRKQSNEDSEDSEGGDLDE
jgi:hypothetical protein